MMGFYMRGNKIAATFLMIVFMAPVIYVVGAFTYVIFFDKKKKK